MIRRRRWADASGRVEGGTDTVRLGLSREADALKIVRDCDEPVTGWHRVAELE